MYTEETPIIGEITIIGYVVPTLFISNGKSKTKALSLDEEVRIIKSYEEKRGNRVEAITPFYYPLYIHEINDYSLMVINPLNNDVYKIEYRIPNTTALLSFVENSKVFRRDFITILNRLRELLKEYSLVKNWIYRGIVLEKVLCDRRVLLELENLISYVQLNEIRGIILQHGDLNPIITSNIKATHSILRDLTMVSLELNRLWNIINEYRSEWEYYFKGKCETDLVNVNKSFETIREVVLEQSMYLSRKLNQELKATNSRYESTINNLRYKLVSFDREIEKIKKRIKHSSNEDKLRYKKLLKEMHRRRKEVNREIKRVEEAWRKEPRKLKKKYMELLNIENRRMKFYERERDKLMHEYKRFIQRIDNILLDINLYIDRINSIINNYRLKLSRFFIRKSTPISGLIYLRGYIILGREDKIYMQSSISIYHGKIILKPIKVFKQKLLKKKLYKEILAFDPRIIHKYNCLKRY